MSLHTFRSCVTPSVPVQCIVKSVKIICPVKFWAPGSFVFSNVTLVFVQVDFSHPLLNRAACLLFLSSQKDVDIELCVDCWPPCWATWYIGQFSLHSSQPFSARRYSSRSLMIWCMSLWQHRQEGYGCRKLDLVLFRLIQGAILPPPLATFSIGFGQ